MGIVGLVLVPLGACGGTTVITSVKPVFPQPPVISSSQGGFLQYFMDCAITTETVGGMQVTGPTYNSALIGPTFRMRPGADVFRINVRNLFPANPAQARTGAFPHDRYTTNLHTHGLTVDPGGNSDNVFRTMPPNTENEVLVEIPSHQPSGTFWYHPHKHGSATYQLRVYRSFCKWLPRERRSLRLNQLADSSEAGAPPSPGVN